MIVFRLPHEKLVDKFVLGIFQNISGLRWFNNVRFMLAADVLAETSLVREARRAMRTIEKNSIVTETFVVFAILEIRMILLDVTLKNFLGIKFR